MAAALWSHSEEVAGLKQVVGRLAVSEREAVATNLSRNTEGIGIVLKFFTSEVCQQVQTIPEMQLRGIQRETNEAGLIADGEYQIRFSQYSYTNASGEVKSVPSIAIVTPQGDLQFAAISDRSMQLPLGTVALARIETLPQDFLTAAMNDHPIKIQKLSEYDCAQTPFLNQAATLWLGYDKLTPIAQIDHEGSRQNLGRIEPASERWLKQQGLLQHRGWTSISSTLMREPGNAATLNVRAVLKESGVQRSVESAASLPSALPSSPQIVGKPVQMVFPLKLHGELNPLPVSTCIDAMRGYGRCHTTRTFEPYAAYQFNAGDIAIAVSGNKQVAFQVGDQYRITPEMVADPVYQQQWAAIEKHSAQELQSFRDKPAWGLHIKPLGDYIDGKIVPFPTSVKQSEGSITATSDYASDDRASQTDQQLSLFSSSEQQSHVSVVAPIVFEVLSLNGCHSHTGTENTAVYDPQTQMLTACDNQTQTPFLVAIYDGQNWLDRGSNISEHKRQYFETVVKSAINAHHDNLQPSQHDR